MFTLWLAPHAGGCLASLGNVNEPTKRLQTCRCGSSSGKRQTQVEPRNARASSTLGRLRRRLSAEDTEFVHPSPNFRSWWIVLTNSAIDRALTL